MKRPKRPKTHFVPKIVLETTFAGVVPVCVAASACGGAVSDGVADVFDAGAGADVAITGFGTGVADATIRDARGNDGVAATAFERGVADIAFRDVSLLTVADVGFCGNCGADVAADAFGDVAIEAFGSVADIAFDVEGGDESPPPDASDAPLLYVANVGFGDAVADAGFGDPDGEAG